VAPVAVSRADHIVVGAGSAGCALVRRLVDAGRQVLLIEAGGPPSRHAIWEPRAALRSLWHTELDWDFWTEPQEHAAARRLHWPRGKVLGGSSAICGMVYTRGSAQDYDAWASAGCRGWDFCSVLPFFKRSEDHEDGASYYHGTGGPLPVRRNHEPHPLTVAFVTAARQYGLAQLSDYNGPSMLGVSYAQYTVDRDRKMNAWLAFLAPIQDRAPLRVVTGALGSDLLFDANRCVGVRFWRDGLEHVAYSEGDVVLCGGVIGSPVMLLRSGIGPAEDLRAIGIAVRIDLPGVGHNLHDHVRCPVVFESPRPLEPLAGPDAEAHFFTCDRPEVTLPDRQGRILSLPIPVGGYRVPAHGFSVVCGGAHPRSRGRLWLRSANHDEGPAIDPNILSEPEDIEVLVRGVQEVREMCHQDSLDRWRSREVAPGPQLRSRSDIAGYVRAQALSSHHQVGTCAMGVHEMAVVDPELKVRGLSNLRVADASIIPSVPAGNTNAPAIMIGEKAASLLLES
jgi:choline dehydrogenase